MRKLSLLMMLCCILTGGVFADFEWNAESGTWNVGTNWTGGVKPDGTQNVNLRKSAVSVCTLNTDEGLFTTRLIVQNGQTWNIENGGRVGFAWSRVGRGNAATVNMSGNGAFVLNNDDLYIGVDAGGNCVWTMADTSSITVNAATTGGDNLYIAQNDSTGKLKLIGSQAVVQINEVYFGDAKTAGTNPAATLEFVMDAAGASTIVTDTYTYILNGSAGANARAHLVLSAPGVTLAQVDIVLVQCLSANAIRGAGVFSTMNGGPATEGSKVIVGGNVYSLTYTYNADGTNNDVALVFLQSAKYLASAPSPANGSTVSASPAMLSWVNPDPNDGVSDITCTVYLGMTPPDPNRTGMDFVTLPANANSVAINADNFETYGAQPIEDVNDFYWVVDCVDSSPGVNPAVGKLPLYWTFFTHYNAVPVVDAGPKQVTWGLPKTISLAAAVSDDGLPNPPGATTVAWTRTSGPASAVINSPASPSTTVTITESGAYVFEVTADDGLDSVSDTVQVVVGTNSCQASYLDGSNYNSKDFNTDCIVDLVDFADFAADWLVCTNTLEGCI